MATHILKCTKCSRIVVVEAPCEMNPPCQGPTRTQGVTCGGRLVPVESGENEDT